MKSILLLLRYFQTVSVPLRVSTWLGWGLLPVAVLCGLFWPRLGFGLSLWVFVFLLAVPACAAPLALRALLSNRRLMMMPRFAGNAVLTLFIHIVMTAAFLSFFAQVYGIQRFPANMAMYIFVSASVYVLIAFVLAGVQWGMQILGALVAPVIVFYVKYLNSTAQAPLLEVATLYGLTVIALLGWMIAAVLATKVRHVAPAKLHGFLQDQQLLVRVGTWLGPLSPGTAGTDAPALSLMLGYPANNYSVLRLKLLAGLLGPLPLIVIMRLTDFNQDRISWPELLQMLMFLYLFSAVVMGCQNGELVARLRLLWLKGPRLRDKLWSLLDSQHLLSQLAFLLLTCPLAALAGVVLSFEPLVLWQYPVLLLALNANTSYYSIYARIKGWGAPTGFIIIGLTLAVSGLFIATALRSASALPLIVLEIVLFGFALGWRHLGKAQFSRVDWQALRLAQIQRGTVS